MKPKYAGDGPPKDPHLVLATGPGTGFPIPVGATIFIVEDPTNPTKVTPLLLVKVTRHGMTFRCACGQAECTRVLKCEKWMGSHPFRQTVG